MSSGAPVRRLRAKTPPAAAAGSAAAAFVAAALGEEQWMHDVGLLQEDARTKHVHYTHGRSADPAHTRPDDMSRDELFEHMPKVYSIWESLCEN